MLATSVIFSTAALACEPIENIESVLSRQVIVLGEIHGTNESPRFAENLVCHLLKAKKRVVLALEIQNNYQSQIVEAINQTSEEAAVAQLGKMLFWRASMQDGKRSIGYMSLLRSAWRWKKQNPEFQVIAVDLPSGSVPLTRCLSRKLSAFLNGYRHAFWRPQMLPRRVEPHLFDAIPVARLP